MRVEVEATGYDTAAAALVGANQSAAIAYHDLRSELSSYRALGGDDASSVDFVRAYDAGAREAVAALAALVAGLGTLAEVTRASARNHRRANAASVYGHPSAYDGGSPGDGPVTVAAFTPPTALGGDNTDTPDWWNHVVDHLQGYGWPSANTGQLRSAASAWRTAAGAVDGLTGDLATAVSHLEQQRSPEIAVATQVLGTTRSDVAALALCLRELGAACEDYAQQVEETRETIRGLLQDLAVECGVTAGFGLALSFVTFGGAAVVGTGVVGVRAVKYAHRIVTALRALKAARAVLTLSEKYVELTRVRRVFENLKDGRKLAEFRHTTRPQTTFRPNQLQKKFDQHAGDFGVLGNNNPANRLQLERALKDFLDHPATVHRSGSYHGDPVELSFNPSSGRLVITAPSGEFVSGWKMTYDKLRYAISTGKL